MTPPRRSFPPAAPSTDSNPDNVPAFLGQPSEAAEGDYERDADMMDPGDMFELSDAATAGWRWYVHRDKTPAERALGGKKTILVSVIDGAVDVRDFHREHGGGRYTFWGYVDRGLKKKIQIELDGEPRSQATAEPQAAAPAAARSADTAAILETIRQQNDAIARLTERMAAIQAAPAAAAPTPVGLAELIQLAKAIAPAQAPAPASDATVVKELISVFKEGVEAGQGREGGAEEGGTLGTVLKTFAPSIERILTTIMLARQGQRPAPGRAPAAAAEPAPSVSTAQVLDTPASEPEPQADPAWTAVVGRLARAIDDLGTERELHPEDMAGTIETLLEPRDVAILRLQSADAIMAELAPQTARWPALAKPEAGAYVAAVLDALKTPPEE